MSRRRKEPKILLIYPPNQLMAIETPRPDGSLGPLYLAGALEREQFHVDVLDATVGTPDDTLESTFYNSIMQPNGLTRIGMSWERIREVIERGGYNVVGIPSNFTPQTRMALKVAEIAKTIDPNILVVAGGINARNLAERFLRDGWVDAICTTEGEKIFVSLVQTWAAGRPLDAVDGIVLWRGGRCVWNPPKAGRICDNLDELPFPAWEKLPLDKYEQIASPHGVDVGGDGARYAPIMTSRGCPFRCLFCHISTEKSGHSPMAGGIGDLRMKSVDRVVEEVRRLKALGVTKLYFEDDSLLAKKARVKSIFTQLRDMGLHVADVNGVNLVHFYKREPQGVEPDTEYMEHIRMAGFDQIVFPVESGSQRVVDKYASGKIHLETLNIPNLVRIAARLGIVCPVNIMIGFPDETEAEMHQSIEIGKRLIAAGAPYVTFFIPIPFPGSRLYDIAIRDGHLDPDFDPDLLNWKNAVMKNTVVPPERVMELRDYAWRTVNTEAHVSRRLRESVGARWTAAEGAVT